ncbi:hypothetical protein BAY1663_04849 [Pseudomonas sp. BAY1663]|nr:hypothetical protein BAY1663_04849 [Pseudomonas sp. BAY1663]
MVGITRHQAGAHPADLATGARHFELRAPGQRHHQLVIIVGVLVGLVIQAEQTGIEHDGTLPKPGPHAHPRLSHRRGIEIIHRTTHLSCTYS